MKARTVLATLYAGVLLGLAASALATSTRIPAGLVILTKAERPNKDALKNEGFDPAVYRDYYVKANGAAPTHVVPYRWDRRTGSGSRIINFQATYVRLVAISGDPVRVVWFGPSQTDTTNYFWISASSDSVANSVEFKTPIDSIRLRTDTGSIAAHVVAAMH